MESADLKASRALAKERQNPLEAGMMGKSGTVTPSGSPEEAALWEIDDHSSSLKCQIFVTI
jgi:hypothetical protein